MNPVIHEHISVVEIPLGNMNRKGNFVSKMVLFRSSLVELSF